MAEKLRAFNDKSLAHLAEVLKGLAGSGGVREDPEVNPGAVASGVVFPDMPSIFNPVTGILYFNMASAFQTGENIWSYFESQGSLEQMLQMLEEYLQSGVYLLIGLLLGEDGIDSVKAEIGETREGYVLPIEQDLGRADSLLDTAFLGPAIDQFYEFAGPLGLQYKYNSDYPGLCGVAMLRNVSSGAKLLTDEADLDLDKGLDLRLPDGGDGGGVTVTAGIHVYILGDEPSGTVPERTNGSWSYSIVVQVTKWDIGGVYAFQMLIDISTNPERMPYWRMLETSDAGDLHVELGEWHPLTPEVDVTALAQDSDFVTALANNQTFVNALVAKLPVVSTETNGLAPKIPGA